MVDLERVDNVSWKEGAEALRREHVEPAEGQQSSADAEETRQNVTRDAADKRLVNSTCPSCRVDDEEDELGPILCLRADVDVLLEHANDGSQAGNVKRLVPRFSH